MAETQSPNYKWIKPDIGGDASTWGNVLNQTIDAVDSVVYANQQAGLPIGSVAMFAGAAAPVNWLICDGSSLSTTGTYAALFAVLGYAYGGSAGNFNLPNLNGAFPLGAGAGSQINVGVGATGGEAAHTLILSEAAAHHHNIGDPGHTHGAYQNAHSHGIATGGHSHGINDPGHAHTGVLNVVGVPGWNSQGPASPIIAQQNTSTAVTGISIQAAGNLGGNTDTQQPGVGINAAATGINTTDTQGGGVAHNNVPPYVALNFIIRFQ